MYGIEETQDGSQSKGVRSLSSWFARGERLDPRWVFAVVSSAIYSAFC